MKSTVVFKLTIVAYILTGIISVILSSVLETSLSPLLQQYLVEYEERMEKHAVYIGFILISSFTIFVSLAIGLIGIWKFKRWGRTFFTSLIVFLYVFELLFGAVVMHPLESLFYDISTALEGAVIAMMYISGDISKKFQKLQVVSNTKVSD